MNQQAHTLTIPGLVIALFGALLSLAPVQAATLPAAVQQEPSSDVLTPAALGNMTYAIDMMPETVQLTDGKYEDTENRIIVMLAPEPMAFGTLNDQDAAAVLLAYNGGGSGAFVYLQGVLDQGGTPVNVASTLLGDRIDPLSLTIADNQIIVEMVTQGPDEPMCCGTLRLRATYELAADNQLVLVSAEPMDLSMEVLKNLEYHGLVLAPGGSAQLTDGAYEDSEAQVLVGMGITPTVAYGYIDGQPAAAVILGETGVGSAGFEHLAVVTVQDGQAVNVATTLLGDRVGIKKVAFTDEGLVVVDMVAQGPNDPMCCPTMPTTTAYGLYGSELAPVLQVAATIDGSPVTDQVLATIIQPTAYDNTIPPSGQGQPKHAVWSLDGSAPDTVMDTYGAHVAIYSMPAWEKTWNDAGDNYVSDTIAQLEQLLTDKPANPEPPLPILPEPPGANDIAAQVAYLELSDGGSGIRWVGRIGQSVEPVLPERLTYYFQGLTADGERLIVAQAPITIPVVAGVYTDSVSAEQMASIESDYTNYLAGVTEALNAEPADAFTPSLEALDQAMQSVTITTTVNDLLPDAMANIEYSSELVGGPVQLTGGKYEDTANRIEVVFIPSPIAYGALDGVPSAAVLTSENGGGSGVFTTLNVVQPQNGLPVAIASTQLGDRVYVNTLDIADNQIVVTLITQGPEDPMCCPTLPVTQTYALADGALRLVNEEQGEPIAAAPAEDAAATDAMTDTAAAAGGAGDLAGTAWSWSNTQMNDGAVVAPAQADQFQVVFNADGAVAATTDCNTFRGRYEVTGNQITIELPISTRMACPEGSQQDAYIERLTSAQSYLMDGSDLILELPFDSGGMRFAPALAGNAEAGGATPVAEGTPKSAALAGGTWRWTGTQMNDETVITPTVADAFQLTFGDDGTVGTTTDCNTFSGSFTEGDRGALTITLPISTLKGCPEDAQEQKYIQDLTSIQSYLTQDGNLYLQLPMDSGTMSFAPVP